MTDRRSLYFDNLAQQGLADIQKQRRDRKQKVRPKRKGKKK